MKKKKSINALRKIVRNEVKKYVKEELERELRFAVRGILEEELEYMSKNGGERVIKEEKQSDMSLDGVLGELNTYLDDNETQERPMTNSSVGPKINTGNRAIDDILKNTRGFNSKERMPINENADGYRNMMSKQFTTDDVQSFGSAQMPPQSSVSSMTGINNSKVDPNSSAGQAIDKAINRDYSELVSRFKK